MAQMVFLLGDLNVKDLSEMLNRLNKGLHVAKPSKS